MNEVTNEIALAICNAMSVQRYELKTYQSSKRNAQLNLNGKTHYLDDDTLKYFHSKIVSSNDHARGLLFSIIESCAADYDNTHRGFRFVIFDLFGTVIERRKNDDMFSSSEKARKARNEFLDSFDVLAWYRIQMTERANSLERQARLFVETAKKL